MYWLLALVLLQSPLDERSASVGMSATIEQVVLPGTELEVRPIDDHTPVVVRIADVQPHGTAWRYELVWYGLEPGRFDLGDFLQRKDRSSAEDLPALEVEVRALLPAGQVVPHALEPKSAPAFGGYRTWVGIAIGVWLVGLVALLLGRRRRKGGGDEHATRPATLAERLRPLVERARRGELAPGERAELERTLLTYWRRRLELGGSAAEALAALRCHEQAGPLIEALERWLHRPGTDADVDVGALLAPYQEVPEPAVSRGGAA